MNPRRMHLCAKDATDISKRCSWISCTFRTLKRKIRCTLNNPSSALILPSCHARRIRFRVFQDPYSTYTTLKARLWLWLSGLSPYTFFSCFFCARKRLPNTRPAGSVRIPGGDRGSCADPPCFASIRPLPSYAPSPYPRVCAADPLTPAP